MMYHQRPKTISERFRHSPVALAVLVIIALFLLKKSWDLFGEERTAKTAAESARMQYESLTARQENLQQKIDRLNTPQGVEGAIREKFGLVKNGEEMVVVVLPAEVATTSSFGGVRGLWYKLLEFFK
ncbi:MAG: FtsB family cell division protein [Minisyncoccota bacterium]